jgi:hypothetical protein
MQCDMLATPDSHAELQAIKSIESSYTLAIHEPAFAPQQHPNPHVAKPRPDMSQIANLEPQGRLILGPTPSIPRSSTELRQPTDLQATDLKRLVKPSGQFSTACGP